MRRIKFFLLVKIFLFSVLLNVAQARERSVNESLKDECAKVFKEVEDMFEIYNTLEVIGEHWGRNLDRAMEFLDWCVKHGLIEIK